MSVIITARKRHLRAKNRGVANVPSPFALILGEFDDQDAILGRHRDQHHQPDLSASRAINGKIRMPRNAPEHSRTGTDSNTGTGIIQLS